MAVKGVPGVVKPGQKILKALGIRQRQTDGQVEDRRILKGSQLGKDGEFLEDMTPQDRSPKNVGYKEEKKEGP
jgi:ribosomal protein L30/L7E